ncbi:hypothetical protein G9A89_007313 [Geosiphon pyriformis]|nr:hypothetical protein G9A89_007313 [Geosiphon pyriformis]
MEKFCSDKSDMIRSVLDRPFHKVVLNHLVLDGDLVLKLEKIKLSVNKIIKNWTQKRTVPLVLSDLWACQYAPLDYVNNEAFLGVMEPISMSELVLVTKSLPDSKSAELSGILNKLWKHCDDKVLGCLLGLLNVCLVEKVVPTLWKRAWVSIIPKLYD